MEAHVMEKDEFRNDSKGQCGVVVIDNGKEKGIALAPGDTILLSVQEQALTANAPRLAQNNPFTNGTLTLIGKASEMRHRRPIGRDVASPPSEEVAAETEKARQASEARAKAEAERAARVKAEQTRAQKQGQQADRPLPAAKEKGAEVEEETAAAGAAENEETGAAAAPAGPAARGQRAAGEEVGTPEAPRQAKS